MQCVRFALFLAVFLLASCNTTSVEPADSPTSTLRYSLDTQTFVRLYVENSYGAMVLKVIDQSQLPGNYSVQFRLTHVPEVLYFANLTLDGEETARQTMLVTPASMVDPESFGVECTQTIHYLLTTFCPGVSDVKHGEDIHSRAETQLTFGGLPRSIGMRRAVGGNTIRGVFPLVSEDYSLSTDDSARRERVHSTSDCPWQHEIN
jgi:hypothetical protein